MKNILFVFLMLLICGCNYGAEPVAVYGENGLISYTVKTSEGEQVKIVTIDGCEYIKNRTYCAFYVYTHKGNCTNPIHRVTNEK